MNTQEQMETFLFHTVNWILVSYVTKKIKDKKEWEFMTKEEHELFVYITNKIGEFMPKANKV